MSVTSRAVAERFYDHQLDRFVGLLINWPSYEQDHEDYEVGGDLDGIERKLQALRRSFPEFGNKPLPDPFRRQ